MNHLVFLDPRAGELEKILSGVKSMIVKDFDWTKISTTPNSGGVEKGAKKCHLQILS